MPATGEIYQVTYQQLCSGQTIENVIHFREKTGLSTVAQIRVSALDFLTDFTNLQVNQVTYTQVIIKQMTPLPFDEDVVTPTVVTSGAFSNAPLNNTLAAILTKRTGTSGKTHRGRMYVGGLNPSDHGNNSINSSGLVKFNTFAAAVIARYGPSGTDAHLQIGVYSRTIGGSSPFTVAGWQPLTRLDPQPLLGNQRRRRLGVGI